MKKFHSGYKNLDDQAGFMEASLASIRRSRRLTHSIVVRYVHDPCKNIQNYQIVFMFQKIFSWKLLDLEQYNSNNELTKK